MNMDRIDDLMINLVAAAIGFSVARLSSGIQRALRLRRARRFWHPFVDGKLYLAFPVFDDAKHTAWDPSGLAGVGDVVALTVVEKHLRSIRLRDYGICYSHLIAGDQLNSNLVLIAGPDANRVSRMAMERLPLTFVFNDPDKNDVRILDRTNERLHCSIGRKESPLTTDFGLIVRAQNPFNRERQILIIAGSYGFGTAAAATLVTTPAFLKRDIVQQGGSFEALFSVDIVANVAQEPIVKEFRELNIPVLTP